MGSMQAAARSPAYAGRVMSEQLPGLRNRDQQKDAGLHSFMQPMSLADHQMCFEAPGFGVAPIRPDDATIQSLDVMRWLAGEANCEVGRRGAAADQAWVPTHSALVDNVHDIPQSSFASRGATDAQWRNCFVSSPQY